MADKDISNEALVRLCVAGDSKAWGIFVERFSSLVFWSIRRRMQRIGANISNRDIEDIHQETFLYIWKNEKLADVKNPSKITLWLSAVAFSRTNRYIEKTQQHATLEISLFENIGSEDIALVDTINSKDHLASEQVDNKELGQFIIEIIETLPAKDKVVISLHYLYDKTLREIAENTGLPQGTVSTVVNRARETIKTHLNKRI